MALVGYDVAARGIRGMASDGLFTRYAKKSPVNRIAHSLHKSSLQFHYTVLPFSFSLRILHAKSLFHCANRQRVSLCGAIPLVGYCHVLCDSVLHSLHLQHRLAVEGDPVRANGSGHDGARSRQSSRKESVVVNCDHRHYFCCVSGADVAELCCPRLHLHTKWYRC